MFKRCSVVIFLLITSAQSYSQFSALPEAIEMLKAFRLAEVTQSNDTALQRYQPLHEIGVPNNAADAIDGEGYFLLVDPNDRTRKFVTRNGSFFFDANYNIVNKLGYRLQGKTYDGIYFDKTLDPSDRTASTFIYSKSNSIEDSFYYGDISLAFKFRSPGSMLSTGNSNPIRVTPIKIATDEKGDYVYNGNHSIGEIIYQEGTLNTLITTTRGWHALSLDMHYAATSDLFKTNIEFSDDDMSQLLQAISNDVYTTLFPNSPEYPHGLEPDSQYKTFIEQLFIENEWIDTLIPDDFSYLGYRVLQIPNYTFNTLIPLAPIPLYSPQEIIAITGSSNSYNEIWTSELLHEYQELTVNTLIALDSFDLEVNGNIVAKLNNDSSFIRAEINLVEILNPQEALKDIGNGTYEVLDSAQWHKAKDSNSKHLIATNEQGLGQIQTNSVFVSSRVSNVGISTQEGYGHKTNTGPSGQGEIQATLHYLDLAINGVGFMLAEQHEGGTPVYAVRGGALSLNADGFLRTERGNRIKGYQLNKLVFATSIDQYGNWYYRAIETPAKDSDVLQPIYMDQHFDGSETIEFSDIIDTELEATGFSFIGSLLATNESGDPIFNGNHHVGNINYTNDSNNLIDSTSGWHAFLVYPTILLPEESNSSEEVAMLQAISDDFYTRLFPNGESNPHGLTVSNDENGIPYQSFLHQFIYETESDTPQVLEAVQQFVDSYPASKEAALEVIQQARVRNAPNVVRFSIDGDGNIRYYFDDGSSFHASRIPLFNVAYPSEMTHLEFGHFEMTGKSAIIYPNQQQNSPVFSVGMIQQGALEQNREGANKAMFNFRINAEGWFQLENEFGNQIVSKTIKIDLDRNGFFITDDEYNLIGQTGGYINYKPTVDEAGNWNLIDHFKVAPSQFGAIGTTSFYINTDVDSERKSAIQIDSLLDLNDNGEPVYLGEHKIGNIHYFDTDSGKIESITGWHAFAEETTRLIETLIHTATYLSGVYTPVPNVINANYTRVEPTQIYSSSIPMTTDSTSISLAIDSSDISNEEKIAAALSKDIYTALFPNSEEYPHGLEPGINESGEQHQSFIEEVVYEIAAELPINLLTPEWIRLIHSTLPENRTEALECIEEKNLKQLPNVARFSVNEEGNVILYLDNGDSLVTSTILAKSYSNPEHLVELDNNRFLETSLAGTKLATDGNERNLHFLESTGVGSIYYTKNEAIWGRNALISWNSIPGMDYQLTGSLGNDLFHEYNLRSSSSRKSYPVHLDSQSKQTSLFQVQPHFTFTFKTENSHSSSPSSSILFKSSIINESSP